VLVLPDRTRRLLDGASATPLGVSYNDGRPQASETLPPRATLLLYTDGLVERRREALDKGIDRAADVIEDNPASALDDLADEMMSRLAPESGYQDDVALMLYRQPVPLQIELPADPQELAATRKTLRHWLIQAGLDSQQTIDVLIAAGEALANAIEHGHRHRREGTVQLRATALADRLHLTITDSGVWRPPVYDPASHRGRGIALMRALMHDVTIEPGEAGTTINMHARIA
jgi:anti-sigma regulatory factor (Ser/Thr protein kinase)